MARAPGAGLAQRGLQPLLGRAGAARLQAALVTRAARWAAQTGPTTIAFTPDDARQEIAALVPEGVELTPQGRGDLGERLWRATTHAAERHGGPVIVVGDDQPALSRHHVEAVVDDFAEGIDVTLGPSTDGGYYLLAARRPRQEVFEIDPGAWGGPRVMELTLQAVLGAGLSVGWLRSERALSEPADAAALLADPCTPRDIAAALRP